MEVIDLPTLAAANGYGYKVHRLEDGSAYFVSPTGHTHVGFKSINNAARGALEHRSMVKACLAKLAKTLGEPKHVIVSFDNVDCR